MKINKALKQKNKLVAELKALKDRLEEYNSVIKGNIRPYDVSVLPDAINAKMAELVALKSNIAKANTKVYAKIFELSELKSLAIFYKKLQIKDGKVKDTYSSDSEKYEAIIKTNNRDVFIQNIETRIELLQDELEEYNNLTEV